MTTTLYLPCTDWGRIVTRGGDRERFLQGLTTVNVAVLTPGGHGWGAILSPKGRVLSVIDIERPVAAEADDTFVVHCEGSQTNKTLAILTRYAVMDDVEFTVESGPAHRVWTDTAAVWTAPLVRSAPPEISDAGALEARRIRAGMPRYGADVDEDAFPFETPLGQFLDYGKGCYVGQEPVFRVHAQGNAARTLRGLKIAGDAVPAVGATVAHPGKSNAGTITSIARDAELGVIGLAYLHRTTWDVGGSVMIGDVTATVCELPF